MYVISPVRVQASGRVRDLLVTTALRHVLIGSYHWMPTLQTVKLSVLLQHYIVRCSL